MKLWELLSEPTARIDELMNAPLDWKWKNKKGPNWSASFFTDDDEFLVMISEDNLKLTNIVFISRKSTLDPTGDGKAFQIFATVADMIREYSANNEVNGFLFSAKEASRAKLYRRLAGMIAKEKGWAVEVEQAGGKTIFTIRPPVHESLHEDGKIIPGVNTTVDVQPGETERQAVKFGNALDAKGRPPLLRGSYGDDSARFSANQGDPFYGSDGTRMAKNKKWT